MVRNKKTYPREKSPEISNEFPEKAQVSKGRTASRGRKPAQARSKSRSRKGTVLKTKDKSRSPSRSRSRSLSRSKSPKKKTIPRSRSHSRSVKNTPSKRTRARSKSKIKKNAVLSNDLNDFVQHKPTFEHNPIPQAELNFPNTKLNEIIRRSISRELSQEKMISNKTLIYPFSTASLKEKDAKNVDGLNEKNFDFKAKPAVVPKKTFNFTFPHWLKDTLRLLIPPLVVGFLHLSCRYNHCHLEKFSIPSNWKRYFSLEASLIFSGFILVQTLLSLLPIGKVIEGPPGINGTLQYRCNGLLVTFLSVGIVASLWYFQYPVMLIYDKLVPLLFSSVIFSYILGVILFIKGGNAPIPALNPASIVESKFHQFFVGREINPIFFRKINVKVLLIRICFNGMLLLNGILALKFYSVKQELSYALCASIGINALLVVDHFWFENSFPSTFQAMYEGAGCWLALKYMLYSFLPTLITKSIILHKVELPLWGLIAVAVTFAIGFVIHRGSNLQKAVFRQCPLNPALLHLEAIPTNRGKKLLVTGWWGWVRHPNYLGFIILHWAWVLSSGFNHITPYFVPLIVTLMMMIRAKHVDSFCHNRYQSAWEEYCNRVRHKLFRYIY